MLPNSLFSLLFSFFSLESLAFDLAFFFASSVPSDSATTSSAFSCKTSTAISAACCANSGVTSAGVASSIAAAISSTAASTTLTTSSTTSSVVSSSAISVSLPTLSSFSLATASSKFWILFSIPSQSPTSAASITSSVSLSDTESTIPSSATTKVTPSAVLYVPIGKGIVVPSSVKTETSTATAKVSDVLTTIVPSSNFDCQARLTAPALRPSADSICFFKSIVSFFFIVSLIYNRISYFIFDF